MTLRHPRDPGPADHPNLPSLLAIRGLGVVVVAVALTAALRAAPPRGRARRPAPGAGALAASVCGQDGPLSRQDPQEWVPIPDARADSSVGMGPGSS